MKNKLPSSLYFDAMANRTYRSVIIRVQLKHEDAERFPTAPTTIDRIRVGPIDLRLQSCVLTPEMREMVRAYRVYGQPNRFYAWREENVNANIDSQEGDQTHSDD